MLTTSNCLSSSSPASTCTSLLQLSDVALHALRLLLGSSEQIGPPGNEPGGPLSCSDSSLQQLVYSWPLEIIDRRAELVQQISVPEIHSLPAAALFICVRGLSRHCSTKTPNLTLLSKLLDTVQMLLFLCFSHSALQISDSAIYSVDTLLCFLCVCVCFTHLYLYLSLFVDWRFSGSLAGVFCTLGCGMAAFLVSLNFLQQCSLLKFAVAAHAVPIFGLCAWETLLP